MQVVDLLLDNFVCGKCLWVDSFLPNLVCAMNLVRGAEKLELLNEPIASFGPALGDQET